MIEIYGKEQCSFCDAAKRYLDNKGIPYSYHQLGADFTTEELKEKAPTARSFPAIFFNNQFIGGYNELLTMSGIIQPMTGGQDILLG